MALAVGMVRSGGAAVHLGLGLAGELASPRGQLAHLDVVGFPHHSREPLGLLVVQAGVGLAGLGDSAVEILDVVRRVVRRPGHLVPGVLEQVRQRCGGGVLPLLACARSCSYGDHVLEKGHADDRGQL